MSIICQQEKVPEDVKNERGWALMQVVGPLPFDAVGVLSRFVSPLAKEGIPLLATATFDTDYMLVRHDELVEAQQALQPAGHELVI
ncbi:MAG: ACT domain-containing protein [Candidatus Synoicihabitans palmerolidicus]|nr:ACT domain-containing protein [Candidatus Synoicihabitans palmerolidicus]